MNTLKDKLASGAVTRGLWQNLPGPELAELVAHAGFDWLVIDGEHGAWDPADIRARLIAAPDAVVRVPCDEAWILKQALDLPLSARRHARHGGLRRARRDVFARPRLYHPCQ